MPAKVEMRVGVLVLSLARQMQVDQLQRFDPLFRVATQRRILILGWH
jgi:hypothetical protein